MVMVAVAQLIVLVGSVIVVPLAILVLTAADTWPGRGFAAAGLLIWGATTVALFERGTRRTLRRRIAGVVAAIGGVLFIVVVVRAPTGVAPALARVQHLYSVGESHSRWALANVVPEVDQLMAGFTAMPGVDPRLTQRQATALKRWTRDIYREMENDAEFRALGSAMGLVYTDLRSGRFPHHAYLYIAPTVDRSRPAPVLLFLHGHGGNFKAYVWLLSKLADRINGIVLAPSEGTGKWASSATTERIAAAWADAQRIARLDETRVHLIGLSNGGLGLSHLLATAPGKYRSFVFLSPVFREDALQRLAFAPADPRPPILTLTGALDDRVPLAYVEDRVREIRRAGAEVSREVFDDANHFLIFSHREQFIGRLERWLAGVR
jgi:pimeloyl-ACP methyl ester carboxylesterase